MPDAPPSTALPRSAGDWLQLAAALLWLAQAALLSAAVQGMADGAAATAALPWAAGFLALGMARSALDAQGARLSFQRARARLAALRAQAVAALAQGSPLDTRRPAAGLAASTLAEQAEAALPYLSRYPAIQLKVMALPLAILAVVTPLTWLAALILLAAAPLIPLFMALVGWRAQQASRERLTELGGMNGFLLDRLRGLATLRALGAIAATESRIAQNAQTLRARTMAVLRIAFLSSAVLELFAALGVAMVAVYVGFHLLGQVPFGAWGARLTLGQGLFVLVLAPSFFEPLRELSAAWHDRAAGRAALAALDALRAPGPLLVGSAAHAVAAPVPAQPPALEFSGVRFVYAGMHVGTHAGMHADTSANTSADTNIHANANSNAHPAPVLDAFTLRVAPGEHVAITGPSGCGKSTVLALAAGLAPVQAGVVSIGGEALDDASACRLRSRMAWVGQRAHVFPGSLRDNVRLGRAGLGDRAAEAALRAAALDGLSASTSLGEAGAGISGGEALRLALARAAADPARDLWLADEPTAHLDAATASELGARLSALAAGKTLLVATHDPALMARMDRIVRLGENAPRHAPMNGSSVDGAPAEAGFLPPGRPKAKSAPSGGSDRRERGGVFLPPGRPKAKSTPSGGSDRREREDLFLKQPGAALADQTAEPAEVELE